MTPQDSLRTDSRAQASIGRTAKVAISVVVALSITALIAAFLLPVGLNEVQLDETEQVEQNTGDTYALTSSVDATLDSTNTTSDTATYTLSDGSSSATQEVSNGSTATFDLDGGSVDVTPQDVTSGSATTEYAYSSDHGWSGGATSLWNIIDMVVVLAVFLFVLSIGLKATRAV